MHSFHTLIYNFIIRIDRMKPYKEINKLIHYDIHLLITRITYKMNFNLKTILSLQLVAEVSRLKSAKNFDDLSKCSWCIKKCMPQRA